MKKKIIAAGHICIDITPVFPKGTHCTDIGQLMVPGRLIQMDAADVSTGGSVANAGLALKLLGADVRLLGKVGNDAFGSMVKDILMNAGIPEIWALRIPFLVCCIGGAIAAMIPAVAIREQDYIQPKTYSQPLSEALKAIFSYKNFTIITIGYLVMWVAFTFFNTAQVYYITNLLALPDIWVTIVTVISIGVGVCTYPLVNILARKVGKKPMLIGACITYVLLYFGIYNYKFVTGLIGGQGFALVIGFCIAMPIAITNIIPASMFADLAQYDTIKTGKNRAGMFLAARNFANKLCQSIVVIACASLLGKGTNGTGAATSEGVQATALVACIFVACAMGIYFFYNDKEIAAAIKESNEAK